MPKEDINQIVFGLSQIDDGSLEIEDFVSIPDLVAGALCETLDRLNQADLRVTSKIILNKKWSYLDGSAVGYLGNEHAHKGTPGYPPAPVEYRPAVHPLQ